MWGENLARNLVQLDALVAVADRNAEAANGFASTFNVTAMSVETLIEHTNIDGIVIATGAASHDELALAGLIANKHIYIEKPLSLSLAGAHAIRDAAKSAKRQVMVGHLIRYHAAFIELQKQLSAGAIGNRRVALHRGHGGRRGRRRRRRRRREQHGRLVCRVLHRQLGQQRLQFLVVVAKPGERAFQSQERAARATRRVHGSAAAGEGAAFQG